MFILGDSGLRSSFPDLSTFFLWQFPFYLYGLFKIIKNKDLGELRFITISMLLFSPLPAAVTRDPYSTIRSLQMVIPLLIIISLGIIESYQMLKKYIILRLKLMKMSFYVFTAFFISVAVVTYSFARLYSSVIILNEYYRAEEWNYGFEQIAATIQKLDQNFPVVVDNSRTEPYSQLLFFMKFDPETYQKENFEVSLSEYYTNMGRNKTKRIGRIVTRPIDWEKDLSVEQYLVGDSLSISYEQIERHNLNLINEIKFPDGRVAFLVVKTNPKVVN